MQYHIRLNADASVLFPANKLSTWIWKYMIELQSSKTMEYVDIVIIYCPL